MNTLTYLTEQYSVLELCAYAVMCGAALALLIGCVITIFRFVKQIINDSKFV